jgi:DNA-binding MarR family transcriptional regulator
MKNKKILIHAESLDDIINYLIYRIARLLRYKFQQDMQAVDLDMTQEQYFILFKLWQKDGQYQAELADGFLGDTPNITRILDVMEKKNYISRRSDSNDRRKCRIFVADKGWKIQSLYKIHAPKKRLADYKNLDDNDLAELKRILKTIEDNIIHQQNTSK